MNGVKTPWKNQPDKSFFKRAVENNLLNNTPTSVFEFEYKSFEVKSVLQEFKEYFYCWFVFFFSFFCVKRNSAWSQSLLITIRLFLIGRMKTVSATNWSFIWASEQRHWFGKCSMTESFYWMNLITWWIYMTWFILTVIKGKVETRARYF